jgi:hypothetical protein
MMDRRGLVGIGVLMVLVGVVALAAGVLNLAFGFRVWHLWPLVVIATGLLLILPVLLHPDRPKLSGLLILGLPTLTTGGILLIASVTRWWRVWSVLWPLEVISVALGFVLTAVRAKRSWLLVPAVIIGANGFVLQFCAATGWWRAWAFLWAVEPIALGISLLLLNARRHSRGMLTAGLALCAIGTVGLFESLALYSLATLGPLWRILRWLTPVGFISGGVVLIIWAIITRTRSQAEAAPAADVIATEA